MSVFNQASVLVTGSSGFIGRRLVTALLAKQVDKVVGVGRSITDFGAECYEHACLDLADRPAVARFLSSRQFDYVFHLAGQIDQSSTAEVYGRQITAHIIATHNVLENLSTSHLRKFVHVGSNAEYGGAPVPQDPRGPNAPNSAYGVTKLAASQLVLAKARSENYPGIVVRPFLVYGPGQAGRGFLAQAIQTAGRSGAFPTSPGGQTRDFVHVDWVVNDMLRAAGELDPGSLVNLCTGVELTLREVLEMIKELAPSFRPEYGKVNYRPTELMRSCGVPYVQRVPDEVRQRLRNYVVEELQCGSVKY